MATASGAAASHVGSATDPFAIQGQQIDVRMLPNLAAIRHPLGPQGVDKLIMPKIPGMNTADEATIPT
jgi:hypothetical protein